MIWVKAPLPLREIATVCLENAMATLIVVEDHVKVEGVILTKEEYARDVDALGWAGDFLREEEARRRGVLPSLHALWIRCDDGRLMNDAAVRRAARGLGASVARPELEAETIG